jgi:hypothetical protein
VDSVPPFATELSGEDARQAVEAKPADDAALGPRPETADPKPRRRRRPPKPPVPKAADGVAAEVAAEQIPELLGRLLRGI